MPGLLRLLRRLRICCNQISRTYAVVSAAAAYGDDVLVETTGGESYTASVDDAMRLLNDLNLTQQAAIYPHVSELINPLTPLQVTNQLVAAGGRSQFCTNCCHTSVRLLVRVRLMKMAVFEPVWRL